MPGARHPSTLSRRRKSASRSPPEFFHDMTHRRVPQALGAALLPLLAACAQQPVSEVAAPASTPAAASARENADGVGGVRNPEADQARVYKGSGVLLRGQGTGGQLPPGPPPPPKSGPVVLNFEGADLREVVRTILGDRLIPPSQLGPFRTSAAR